MKTADFLVLNANRYPDRTAIVYRGRRISYREVNERVNRLAAPHGVMLEADNGMLMPAYFALLGSRHMHELGTTPEQFAKIAVKNHKHSALNPYAHYQKVFTLEEIMESRMVCDPLTLLQCCPIGDGAAAVVLTTAEKAKQHTIPAISLPIWLTMTCGKN